MSTGRIRPFFWYVATFGASLLTVYLGMKAAGYLYYTLGRAAYVVMPHFIIAACGLIAVACFFVLRYGTTKAGGRIAALSHPTLAIPAILCGVASLLLGDPPIRYFLDGFADRVSIHLKESEAVAWADQVFANTKPPRSNQIQHVTVPHSEVPAFFPPVFGTKSKPTTVIYYSHLTPDNPYCVTAFTGGGLPGRRGVTIYNTNSVPTGKMAPLSRRCGERIFVWCSSL